jgi:hypothetical protein
MGNKSRRYFRVTLQYMNIMIGKYGKVPTCEICGRKFRMNEMILSKVAGGGNGFAKTKRYCNKCRKKYGIWLPSKTRKNVKPTEVS